VGICHHCQQGKFGITVQHLIQRHIGLMQMDLNQLQTGMRVLIACHIVDYHASFGSKVPGAVLGMEQTSRDPEANPISRGCRAIPEGCSERKQVMIILEGNDSPADRFLADIPV